MRGNVITGAGYFFRGLAMLNTPGIRGFVLVPRIANIMLFGLLGNAAYNFLSNIYIESTGSLPEWLAFLNWIIAPFFWLAGALITGYVSTFVVLMLTSPFHSLLAEKVEEQVTGESVPSLDGFLPVLMEVPRGLLREIFKVLYYLPTVVFVLIISFIPGINAIAPLLWFILGAWMMSLQFADYPMDNHRLPFRDVREACAARRLSSLGFGGTVAFIASLPIVNLIVIPAAVIGATLFWCDELRPRR